jgi:hypothetical protein
MLMDVNRLRGGGQWRGREGRSLLLVLLWVDCCPTEQNKCQKTWDNKIHKEMAYATFIKGRCTWTNRSSIPSAADEEGHAAARGCRCRHTEGIFMVDNLHESAQRAHCQILECAHFSCPHSNFLFHFYLQFLNLDFLNIFKNREYML